jgi:hypothetical protein
MNSWKLLLDDGTELSEQEAQYWDNVPMDKKIKQATFILLNGSKLVFDKFDSLCIAKLGVSTANGDTVHTGYRITVIKTEEYDDFMITSSGVNKSNGKVSELTISEKCFRQGIK